MLALVLKRDKLDSNVLNLEAPSLLGGCPALDPSRNCHLPPLFSIPDDKVAIFSHK